MSAVTPHISQVYILPLNTTLFIITIRNRKANNVKDIGLNSINAQIRIPTFVSSFKEFALNCAFYSNILKRRFSLLAIQLYTLSFILKQNVKFETGMVIFSFSTIKLQFLFALLDQ